jgi:F1F0 ATPase subunit 2
MISALTGPPPSLAAQFAIGLAAGIVVGAWHFVSLNWNWPLFANGKTAAALALQCTRIALTCSCLLILARVGALALLVGMAGVLLARRLAMLRYGGLP